jgi:predicted nucleotidyltransferase component of viral defense system
VKPIKNVSASVHQRLLNLSRQSGRPFNELAQFYALERWLYRLARSDYRNHFVLKGALMLLAWEMPFSRPTRDIDLLGRVSNDLDLVRNAMAAICRIPTDEDGMVFDHESVVTERIAEDADYHGVRATFSAHLGNAIIPMQIDIGFSDVITPEATTIVYPSILGHAAPVLRAYNRETVIAEKFETMVKLGELNSRMKDFFDIWLLAKTGQFRRPELSHSIEQTFSNRGTALIDGPVCLTEEFAMSPSKVAQWTAFLRRNRFTKAPDSFLDVVNFLAEFLRPIVISSLEKQDGNFIWDAGGPWRSAI